MTHPITPPPDLVQQWADKLAWSTDQAVFTSAAQWGADQELEACCEWLERNYNYPRADHPLRTARRPKPPSLKEQALEVVTGLEKRWDLQCDLACLRRALEALPQ
ncbi:MAG: hypothetical protein EBR82_30430 [Caulobacteraceae bacterium]|nr:hypothetical protein [Caulobacteraceae bacterium]